MLIKERMVQRNHAATWKRAQELRKLDTNGCRAIHHLCATIAFCSDSDSTLREVGSDYIAIREQALKDCLAILVEQEDRYIRQREYSREKRRKEYEEANDGTVCVHCGKYSSRHLTCEHCGQYTKG